jgi:hypothetical protein
LKRAQFGILIVLAVLVLVSIASAQLPSQVTAKIASPGPASYWDVSVTGMVGPQNEMSAIHYAGKCASSTHYINNYQTYTFDVYSSLGSLPSGLPTANWQKINWVINNKQGANPATIQAVVWHYDSGIIAWNPGAPLGPVNTALRDKIIHDTDTFMPSSYAPGPGENYAVILWNTARGQPIFIELPIPDIPVPEFPTLGLPVAMLVGVVGAVHYVRTRKD